MEAIDIASDFYPNDNRPFSDVSMTLEFTLGEPSLSLLATGGCGRNSAPAAGDESGTVVVTVTAVTRTPTGDLRSGTTVN